MNRIISAAHRSREEEHPHEHPHWEYVYLLEDGELAISGAHWGLHKGEAVVIPPQNPHVLTGLRMEIHLETPLMTVGEAVVIPEEPSGLMAEAFRGACHHIGKVGSEQAAMMRCYGELISRYLMAGMAGQRTGIADDIERTIHANCTNCDFKLDKYLATLPFSEGYLRKVFQRRYGLSPHQYLVTHRLGMAAEALRHGHLNTYTVGDVALMCGFRDPLYFSKMFKKEFGVAPSQFGGSSEREE